MIVSLDWETDFSSFDHSALYRVANVALYTKDEIGKYSLYLNIDFGDGIK